MNNHHPQNLLVTGGAGFIGSHFIKYYSARYPKARIVNLDKLTYAGSLDNLTDLPNPLAHIFIQGDIGDNTLLQQLFREYHIDTVVHFAAETHVDRSIAASTPFITTNIVGTHTLLQSALEYWLKNRATMHSQRFHHISTDEVYGSLTPDEPAFTEHSPYQPRSPYAASKASSDHLVRAYYHTHHLPVTLSACSNNFGTHQHPEKFIPTVILACLQAQPIPIYGNGNAIRDWLYVENHCAAIEAILHRGQIGETYNIGGHNEWRNLALVHLLCGLMDEYYPRAYPHAELISFVADRKGHDLRYAINPEKIMKQLHFQPNNDFKQTLLKTIVWYAK